MATEGALKSPPDGIDRIGRYELLAELGSGGMASVHLARIVGPGTFRKLVALKKIHEHLSKKRDFVEMFVDEATLAARITHQNTCTVIDFGEVDGTWYLAMEYLEGAPLSTVIRASRKHLSQHPEDFPEYMSVLFRVIIDACKGLHAAHSACDERGRPLDIVHRDISPDNIFVTFTGLSKVVDFGIARGKGRIHQTSTGIMKGKIGYLSPENFARSDVDRRTDLWALGVVLWEGLCLNRLFWRENEARTMSAILSKVIPKPSSEQPLVPDSIDAVVLKALERECDQRWNSAKDLGESLESACQRNDLAASETDIIDWLDRVLPGLRQALRLELNKVLEQTEPSEVQIPKDLVSGFFNGDFEQSDVASQDTKILESDLLEDSSKTEIDSPSVENLPTVIFDETAVRKRPEQDRPTPVIAAAKPPFRFFFWISVFFSMFVVGTSSFWITGLFVSSEDQSGGQENFHASLPTDQVRNPEKIPTPQSPEPDLEEPEEPPPENPTKTESEPSGQNVPDGGVEDGSPESEQEDPEIQTPVPPRPRPSPPRPPPRTKRRTQKSEGFGKVRVTTPGGWAEVFFKGVRKSKVTPTQFKIPSGRQVLELRFFGKASQRKFVPVNIQRDKTAKISVRAPQ